MLQLLSWLIEKETQNCLKSWRYFMCLWSLTSWKYPWQFVQSENLWNDLVYLLHSKHWSRFDLHLNSVDFTSNVTIVSIEVTFHPVSFSRPWSRYIYFWLSSEFTMLLNSQCFCHFCFCSDFKFGLCFANYVTINTIAEINIYCVFPLRINRSWIHHQVDDGHKFWKARTLFLVRIPNFSKDHFILKQK